MSGALLPGVTSVTEALDNPGSCRLVSSDGAAGSLYFQTLCLHVQQATGMHVSAETASGLVSRFNPAAAGVMEAVGLEIDQSSQPEMDYTTNPQTVMIYGK